VALQVGADTITSLKQEQKLLSAQVKDARAQLDEVVVAQQRQVEGAAVPPRTPGTAAGAKMRTPPPRRPDLALVDDLDIPPYERMTTTLLRKFESTTNISSLELEDFGRGTLALYKRLGIDPRTITEAESDLVLAIFHGERPLSALPPKWREPFQVIRGLKDLEESEMLDFLTSRVAKKDADFVSFDVKALIGRFLNIHDYFPRWWKQKPIPKGAPKGRVGVTPGFAKPRVPQTFLEMRAFGLEPLHKDPMVMMALKRYDGVRYRNLIRLMSALKLRGKLLPLNEMPESGWRVPRGVGPLFEGRPIPDPQVKSGTLMSRQLAVPHEVADFLEGEFGRKADLIVNLMGRDVDVLRVIDALTAGLKLNKLTLSWFQHIDIATRTLGATFSKEGFRSGAPLKLPSLAKDLFESAFIPAKRAAMSKGMLSTKPIIKGRGISERMLVEEGLNIKGDISIIERHVWLLR